MYPRYYKLVDHGKQVSVIMVYDLQQQAEVEHLCREACKQCDHTKLIGACLEIVPATKEEWIGTHG
jgi:hypothetical protein